MKYLFIVTVLLAILIAMIVLIVKVQPKRQCVKEKEIVAIDVVPLVNFWGKKINYIIRYSDGTMHETTSGNLYGIGQKQCIEYERRKNERFK